MFKGLDTGWRSLWFSIRVGVSESQKNMLIYTGFLSP